MQDPGFAANDRDGEFFFLFGNNVEAKIGTVVITLTKCRDASYSGPSRSQNGVRFGCQVYHPGLGSWSTYDGTASGVWKRAIEMLVVTSTAISMKNGYAMVKQEQEGSWSTLKLVSETQLEELTEAVRVMKGTSTEDLEFLLSLPESESRVF